MLGELPEFTSKGDLEYCIFKLMKLYASRRDFRYTQLHDVVYAAVHCGDEFRRHYLDQREDDAIRSNGQVIPLLPGDNIYATHDAHVGEGEVEKATTVVEVKRGTAIVTCEDIRKKAKLIESETG